jgi:hypothetical protein
VALIDPNGNFKTDADFNGSPKQKKWFPFYDADVQKMLSEVVAWYGIMGLGKAADSNGLDIAGGSSETYRHMLEEKMEKDKGFLIQAKTKLLVTSPPTNYTFIPPCTHTSFIVTLPRKWSRKTKQYT